MEKKPELDPDSEPDRKRYGSADPDPHPMSWIPNTANEDRGYLGNGGGPDVASIAVEEHLPSSGRTHLRDLDLAAGTFKHIRGKHPLKKTGLS